MYGGSSLVWTFPTSNVHVVFVCTRPPVCEKTQNKKSDLFFYLDGNAASVYFLHMSHTNCNGSLALSGPAGSLELVCEQPYKYWKRKHETVFVKAAVSVPLAAPPCRCTAQHSTGGTFFLPLGPLSKILKY